jgi:hypothetical protein
MITQVSYGFAGGLVVGLLLAWIWRKLINPLAFPNPDLVDVTCANGTVHIEGTLGGTLPPGVSLLQLHVKVYDDENHTVPVAPTGEGATTYLGFPVDHPHPDNTFQPPDKVAVWAEWKVFGKATQNFSCSGSSSVNLGRNRPISPAAAEQLEAVPKKYGVSTDAADADQGGGAITSLALPTPGTLLDYVPERSTPLEPLWRLRESDADEWTLHLLHGPAGFGAVLSLLRRVGGKEERLTWVTSNWRFHVANRLIPESADGTAPILIVSPA